MAITLYDIIDELFPERRNYRGYKNPVIQLHNSIARDIERIRQDTFRTDCACEKDDHTVVIHVGEDVKPEDISVELSTDKKTITVEARKFNDNGVSHYVKQSYSNSNGFDAESIEVELSYGDLIVYAPLVKEIEKPERIKLEVKHNEELEGSQKEDHDENETTQEETQEENE